MALLRTLANQGAVAVQNAQLHEHAKRLGEERVRALEAERAASKRSAALHEISNSFAESLSLDATLDAVAKTAAELLQRFPEVVDSLKDGRLCLTSVVELARSVLAELAQFEADDSQFFFGRERLVGELTSDDLEDLTSAIPREASRSRGG